MYLQYLTLLVVRMEFRNGDRSVAVEHPLRQRDLAGVYMVAKLHVVNAAPF